MNDPPYVWVVISVCIYVKDTDINTCSIESVEIVPYYRGSGKYVKQKIIMHVITICVEQI